MYLQKLLAYFSGSHLSIFQRPMNLNGMDTLSNLKIGTIKSNDLSLNRKNLVSKKLNALAFSDLMVYPRMHYSILFTAKIAVLK